MLSTFVIALGTSADAFAAAVGKGAAAKRLSLRDSLRIGVIFGAVEAVMPIIGWAIGIAASPHLAAVDHWIAFGLLGAIGLKMAWEGCKRPREAPAPRRHATWTLFLTAIGASIDALAVGVTLSLIGADILTTALLIGAATCCMAALGAAIGRIAGARVGRAAEIAGGLALIAVGASIPVQHLALWT